ncbi:Piso0_001920 [Millerozyma farinosa CBS 7064]|uniref:Piso0_001920 protein n=1 Tax=Pichia sorbitophila (strain ATCC MYA-4447 / BCRC 22081 / CBS 7064 / NBRC 10061 / NRRL Y-12695) TaxID=559304 RepID=G8YB76_PICSO|nr:Piso0_001920 [Millerozyma farinosa CBS 7064]
MPKAINKENEYGVGRSKVVSEEHQGREPSNEPPQTQVQTQVQSQRSIGLTSQQDNGKRDTQHGMPERLSEEGIINSSRQYLGDVSNQYGLSSAKQNTTGPKRRPLGGDIAPLQQQQRLVRSSVSYATSTSGSGTKTKHHNILALQEPKGSNTEHSYSSNTSIFKSTQEAHEIPAPSRLPQKRQATESSTNLVEKLHITDSENAVSYKKTRIIDYDWQDLDEEDNDDPLMVSEYVNDIFPYLNELEYKTLPDSQYLFKQKQLKPKMRSILVDWLVEMHTRFRLLPETLFLAINIMDRFMSLEVVQIDKLQLLATGSLFIAAKYEEVFSPSVKNYAYFTDGSYTEEEILQAEKFILTILNFDLNYPNPMNFLRRISKADDYDVQSRTLGKYLLEITIIDYKFIGVLPSLCSASAMYISRLILGKRPVWNGNLIHYSGGYKVHEMKPIIELITQYLAAPVEHDEFFKKYATRKFMKASIICRSWAKKVISENKDIFASDLCVDTAT